MRIMLDTNVLLSALVFGSAKMAYLMEKVAEEHTMVLPSCVIDEFRDVVTRKSPKYNQAVDVFFARLSFEMVYTPTWFEFLPDIRDEKDKPLLASAISSDVDILITGDKDFHCIDIERPQILKPSDFLEKYCEVSSQI
jgi:putative PIN family toxin of toxin-antitoxin system